MCEAFSSSEAYQSLAAIETITVTGRTRQPLVRKLNLFWWFMNDFEPTPPDWYRPTQPLRTLFWYLRNPLQNAGRYVLGVADRNYTVTGMWPVLETVWEDVRWSDFPHFAPRHGWKLAGILGLAAERVCGREVQPAGLSVLAAAAVRIRRLGPRAAVGVDASYCPGDTSRDPRVCRRAWPVWGCNGSSIMSAAAWLHSMLSRLRPLRPRR